jgi:hypothetical protein
VPGPTRPRATGGRFVLPDAAAEAPAATGAAGSSAVALLGLQEAPEPPDRRARRRAGAALAELRGLQLDLLRGAPSAARATRLAALAEGEAVQDPALAAVVAEVALRARIEAAREGRAPAKRAAASQL